MVNTTNLEELWKFCKDMAYALDDAIFHFLKNISEDDFLKSANDFELEIMETQGFITMLYIHELHHNRFEDTVTGS